MVRTAEPEVAHASNLFMTENRQFHSFIIITMILIGTHDPAIS